MRGGVDRQTGDYISGPERVSLMAQSVMRRWTFVLVYTAVTVLWWTHPHWFGDDAGDGHWQDFASYMALLIESVVGIGMFSWARRDSQVLRRLYELEKKAQDADTAHAASARRLEDLMARLEARPWRYSLRSRGGTGGRSHPIG